MNRSKIAQSRRVLILTTALMFFYGFLLGSQQLVITDVAAFFQVKNTGMGVLVSAQYMAAVIFPVVMGSVADRIGNKPVLVAFSAAFGIGCFLMGVSGTLLIYVTGALFAGAGYSVCESISSAVAADLDEEKGMGYINLMQCLLCVGAITGPVAVRFAQSRLHATFRTGFYLCAAAFLFLAVLLAVTTFPGSDKKESNPEKKSSIKEVFTPLFFCLFLSIVIYVGLENGYGYFVEALFLEDGGTAAGGAAAISAYWAGMAISRFLFSRIKYEPGRLLRTMFTAIMLLFVILVLGKADAVRVAVAFGIGFAYGPIWSTLVGSAAYLVPEHASSAVGIMSAGCGIGGVIFPILMGRASDHISVSAAFLFLAASAAFGGLLCLALKKKSINKE